MKKFMRQMLAKFVLPLILLSAVVICWDPFKVFRHYDDFYGKNRILGNREYICLQLFNSNPQRRALSNFIIGSSRSQAFKTGNWAGRIGQDKDRCFHFDASGMCISQANAIISFLDKNVDSVNNIMLIADKDFFADSEGRTDLLYAEPPQISGKMPLQFYWSFFHASLNPAFIISNVAHFFTHKPVNFSGNFMAKSRYDYVSDNLTGDIWYSADSDIYYDSAAYYGNLIKNGEFFTRPASEREAVQVIGARQISQLLQMQALLARRHCRFRLIISPLYDQTRLNHNDREALCGIFGEQNVYDFSGKNELTESKYGYYEKSHFKPSIANRVMDKVWP